MKSDKKIPEHIAIIMDGNGRWAKKRLLPRNLGHREGVKTIDRVAELVYAKGVKYLTLFAFSTENWNRPTEEVSGLMDLFKRYIKTGTKKAEKNNAKIKILGDLSPFDDETKRLVAEKVEKTKNNGGLVMCICFNYGGRAEILGAVNKLVAKGAPVTETDFTGSLYTADIPDPDIIIRTGGEKRISNFLLYQSAYAEIFFSDTLWPDFDEAELNKAIASYRKRNRRYGEVK